MKSFATVAAVGAAAAQAMTLDADVQLFNSWKLKHDKAYKSDDHELTAFQTFKSNAAYINAHNMNSEKHGFTLGLNHLADMTNQEYQQYLLGSGPKAATNGSTYIANHLDAPASKDWRDEGYVTPIKDQGQCGSCWAFSTVAGLEGQYFAKNQKLVSLAEQQLVDCSSSFGNMGCNGGLMDNGFEYIETLSDGLCTEDSYQYTASDGSCKASSCTTASPAATVTGYTDINQGSEDDLTNALATVGPVSVAIDASHQSFQFYKSGVYHELLCSSTRLDHGVTAVGYGTMGSKDYYIVKNSWGTVWGEQGYINMARNKNNNCGIASSASYPLV
jgi:cathepsin L